MLKGAMNTDSERCTPWLAAGVLVAGLVGCSAPLGGTERAAPATEAQRCVDGGGTWQRVCMMGTLACVVPHPDAGKSCTDGSACAGKRCLAPQGTASFPGQGPMQGQCIANNNPCYFGINIEKGLTVPTAVAD